ncbi:MAG: radical SAM/SPASM domain-containing protein [Anaerolineae bacterium]
MKPIWAARDRGRWLRRAWNRALLRLGYRLRVERAWGRPRLLMVEPTNLCNLRCPLCPVGAGNLRRPPAQLALPLYRRLLADLEGALERLLLYNYGEPFLHPHLLDMIALAHESEVYTRISTNGLLLDRAGLADDLIASGLDYLRVSVDGVTQATYSTYRVGGDLESVLGGVRLLQERKLVLGRCKPIVELQMIAMAHNEHEIPRLRALAQEWRTRLRIKTVGLGREGDREGRRDWLPQDEGLRRYGESGGCLELATTSPPRLCDQPWHRLVVNSDGSVVPCCYDPHGEYVLGQAAEGILAVWNGAAMRQLRRALKAGEGPPICRRCSAPLWSTERLATVQG